MSAEQDQKPETTTARWVYGGVRVNTSGQRRHAFIDLAELDDWETTRHVKHEKWYQLTNFNAIVGGIYDAKVGIGDESGVLYGKPVWAGISVDADTRRTMYALDTAAKAKLSRLADERGRMKDSPLDELLEPVIEVLKTLKTGAEKDLVIAHILRRLTTESWNAPKPRKP